MPCWDAERTAPTGNHVRIFQVERKLGLNRPSIDKDCVGDCGTGWHEAGVLSPPCHTTRSTISFLISAIALAGFRPLGQVVVQFMIV